MVLLYQLPAASSTVAAATALRMSGPRFLSIAAANNGVATTHASSLRSGTVNGRRPARPSLAATAQKHVRFISVSTAVRGSLHYKGPKPSRRLTDSR